MKKNIILYISYLIVVSIVIKLGFLEYKHSLPIINGFLITYIIFESLYYLFNFKKHGDSYYFVFKLLIFISFYKSFDTFQILKILYFISLFIYIAVNIYAFVVKRNKKNIENHQN